MTEPPPPSAAIEGLLRELQDARRHLTTLWTSRLDLAKAKLRRALIAGGACVLGLFMLLVVLATVLYFLFAGLASALGELVGKAWAGELIVAVATLSGITVLGFMAMKRLKGLTARTLAKYQGRKES